MASHALQAPERLCSRRQVSGECLPCLRGSQVAGICICCLALLVLCAALPSRTCLPLCRACRLANDLADLLAPQSGAYYDVWLDGEKFYAHTMEVGAADCGSLYCIKLLPV